MLLVEWVNRFINEERIYLAISPEQALAQAIAAVNFYAGYATLTAHIDLINPFVINSGTEITLSEWALIKPLFLLYIEREISVQTDMSRTEGIDYGRSLSEIAQEIAQYEQELLPKKAFSFKIISI